MIIILLLNLDNAYGGHFEGEPFENERDAKFWVRQLNGPSHEIFVLSVKQTHLILAFSLCLLHMGHNLDPDDSEVLFHLTLNHALMRQVRINSKIINCCVLWNGWFEQWGGKQRSMKINLFFELEKIYCHLKLVQKNYQEKKFVPPTQPSLYGLPIDVLLQSFFPHFNLFPALHFEYSLVRYNNSRCSFLLWVLGSHR